LATSCAKTPYLLQGDAAIVVGFRIVRFDFQGALVAVERVVKSPEALHRDAAIVVGFRLVRLDF
jgi:hypothetical protein